MVSTSFISFPHIHLGSPLHGVGPFSITERRAIGQLSVGIIILSHAGMNRCRYWFVFILWEVMDWWGEDGTCFFCNSEITYFPKQKYPTVRCFPFAVQALDEPQMHLANALGMNKRRRYAGREGVRA